MLKIIMTQTRYELKAGTKTVYREVEKDVSEITEVQYKNIINSSPFFRRIGGSETHIKSYTCYGYCTTKLISKSPDKQNKTVREFEFAYI